ncbi:MAG: GxxExxY protein [Gemmatimonadaceae bacterium]
MELAELNKRTGIIVDAAMKVHSVLGPGLLESAYEACLAYELRKRGLHVQTQVWMPVRYEEVRLKKGYRVDMLIDHEIVIENKACSTLTLVDHAQTLSNLKLSKNRVALMINYHVRYLKDGIHRFMN